MSDRNQRIILWAILSSIVIADILVYIWLFKLIFNWNTTIVAGVIGFSGAIIGGLLTLIGVRSTIMFQIRKDKYNRLPKIINNSWKIQGQIAFTMGLKSAKIENKNIDDEKLVEDFYKDNEGWVTELAAEVDPRAYGIVNRFFDLISDYHVYKKRGDNTKWETEAFQCHCEMSELIDEFEKEYKNFRFY